MKKILVIQHEENEGLGFLEKEIELQGMACDFIKTFANPSFPSGKELENYGALITLGSGHSANDSWKIPWIGKEFLIVQEALRQKMPILGVCFGAQMLARTAGARVYKGKVPEIGWGWIRFDDWFSKRNPLTFQMDLSKPHQVFQWHEETFDFPVEGYRLAWNDTYRGQMFAFQGNAIGIQFHVEMDEKIIQGLVEQNRDKLTELDLSPERILEETKKYLSEAKKMCHRFFYGFASLVRENVRRAA